MVERLWLIIAETAADRMAGGAGSPVTPTFLACSVALCLVPTQRTQRSPILIVGTSRYCSSVHIFSREMAEAQIADDPAVKIGDLCVR